MLSMHDLGLVLIRPFEYLFLSPIETPFWAYWITCPVLAAIVYCTGHGVRPGLKELWIDAKPRGREGWRVVKTDLVFFFVNFFVLAVALAPFVVITSASSNIVYDFLARHFGQNALPFNGPGLYVVVAILGTAAFIVSDLAFFCVHYAFHKIPILWEFHKIHHAPKDLWFLTNYRGHPVNLIAYRLGESFLTGIVVGSLGYLLGQSYENRIAFSVIFIGIIAAGGMLRHTRIWVHFGSSRIGRVLNIVFATPAHHQMHHSIAPEHWDKNFGALLSLWDRLIGTLVLPGAKQELTFGISGIGEGDRQYDYSLHSMYLDPFIGAWEIIGKGWKNKQPKPVAEVEPLQS